MKQLLNIIAILLLFTVGATYAQDTGTSDPDQNPNWRKGYEEYADRKDTLLSTMGTTVHDTYEAIDPMEWKREFKQRKKEMRLEYRMKSKLARAQRPVIGRRQPMYRNHYQPGYRNGPRYNPYGMGIGYRNYTSPNSFYGMNYSPYQGFSPTFGHRLGNSNFWMGTGMGW